MKQVGLNKNMGKDILTLSFSKMIVVLISMIIAMLLSRFLTLNEYGTYSQLIIIVNLSITIFTLGLPNSINFFLAKTDNAQEQRQFLSIYYTLSTVLSILTGLILVLTAPIMIRYFDNPLLSSFIYILAILPWTKLILTSIENVLIVYNKTDVLIYFRIINSIFLIFAVILVKLIGLDFSTYMMIYIIIEIIFTLIAYLIVNNIAYHLKVSIDKASVKTILKFSFPIGLASIVGILTKEFDKLMIGGFYDTEKLAIYTNAARELPVTVISASITAILMPQLVRLLSKKENVKAIELWGTATSLSYLFICYFAIGIFVFAPDVMTLLYSSKYQTGVSIFRIYSLVLLFRCTYFGMILNSVGKNKFILYSSVITFISNVILNFIFYYLFGFSGPAIATLIATFISAGGQLLWTSRILSIPFKQILPWKDILNITLQNIILGIIFAFIKNAIQLDSHIGQIPESIVLGLIWGVIYIAINYKCIIKKYKKLNK